MEAALDELADAGDERLLELSSGQFSLEVVERELMVRDHANADELRSARTLSGGETFLASLSLALALADATERAVARGRAAIESIFLDEGFGTLDPARSTSSATAIEELGSAGRMVAVVTHIRELADRMPVRLEVTKVGASSTRRAGRGLMRFSVETWAPEYGSSVEAEDLDDVSERVDATVERTSPIGRRSRRRPGRRPERLSSSTACGASTPGSGSTTGDGPTPACAPRSPPASSSAPAHGRG